MSFTAFELNQLFSLIALPVLAGILGAITGSLVASAIKEPKAFWGWMTAAIVLPVVLSTLYLSSSALVGGLVVVLTVLTFSARLNIANKSDV